MKKTKIFDVWADESTGQLHFDVYDEQQTVLSLADKVASDFADGDTHPMNVLLGVCAHVLARFQNEKIECEFCDNLKASTKVFRETYKRFGEEMRAKGKN